MNRKNRPHESVELGRAGCRIDGVPGASTGRQTAVSEHGPLDQYLMERNAEIALARSAAPESIAQEAEILVLGQHGYETAVKERTVSSAWCGDHGPLEPTIPIFEIPNCGPRSV